jgi:hypothetical protein
MKEIQSEVLEASIANPLDEYEVDLIVDAASVGITDPLSSTGRRMEWTEEVLASTIDTLRGMPVNLHFSEDGKISDHSTTVIGRVDEVGFDRTRGKAIAKAKLWKHYFPDTIAKLASLYKDKKAQVSIEFMPTKMEASEDGEVDRPMAGRFMGLGIVDKGADRGNFVHLMASAKKEEANMKLEEARKSGVVVPGSFEWVANNFTQHLTASNTTDNFADVNVVATYPDNTIWYQNGTYYQTPYTIDRTSIKFGDTIEVEQDFKPLSASEEKGEDTPPIKPSKEADKPMAEISDAELQALKASADKTEDLTKELETLKASLADAEKELETANEKLEEASKREEDARLERLAASRMDEVEKIQSYDDTDQRKEDLEAFKTMDDRAFSMFKRALTASAATGKGGVPEGDPLRAPKETRQDPDGAAAEILDSEDYKRLIASVSATKEDK